MPRDAATALPPQLAYLRHYRPSPFRGGRPEPLAPFATAQNNWIPPVTNGRGFALPYSRTVDRATLETLKRAVEASVQVPGER